MTLAIGFQGPLSGPFAWFGTGLVHAVELALPADGSIRLEVADAGCSSKEAGEAARKLASNPDLLAIVGPTFSRETEAAGGELDAYEVPFVLSVATKPELGRQGWRRFFRIVATDEVRAPATAKLIARTLRAERPGILRETTETGERVARLVADALSVAGCPVVGTRQFARGGCSSGDALALLDDADAVFFIGEDADAAVAATSLKSAGASIPFISDDGARTPAFIEAAGPAAEGAIAVVPSAPAASAGPTFEKEYTARHGSPVVFATEAYQAALLLTTLIGAGASDRRSVTQALREFRGTIAGRELAFTEAGENLHPYFYAYRVTAGRWTPWQTLPGEPPQTPSLSLKESR